MFILQQNNKMVKSKRKDVTMQGFCKITGSQYLFNFSFGWEEEGEGEGWGRVLTWVEWKGEGGGVLVGANSRLGTYPNKYG